ncbi:hypothetical protein BGZ67_003303 [Mortierella alpina]|nr:hypothetical protein BGZ67_003303 [Mortierella alpina]
MWGRLLTSIFSSGPGSDNGENEQRDGEGGASTPRELSSEQQRLLLTPLSQQQQVHPLYQQQLFFYADEVIDSDLEDMAINNNRRRSTSEASGLRRNSTSLLTALATDASLQGELAQEDGRESLEMADLSDMVIVRPETLLGGDGSLVPKTLSPEGKISVASLALSSPPSYWEAAVKYQGWPQIDKRPEQGQESLPRYSCSVFREGCVNRKTELVGNWRPYRRPWKRTFAHLRGTALRLYAVDMEDVPRLHVRNISLQLAKCEIAADYKQRPNVIRIQACDRTVLLECKDRIDALTWLEHLQAAANISTSLEDRSMPKFYTLPRAQHHPAAHSGSGSRSSSSSTASNRYHSSGGGSQLQQQQQQQQSSMSQAPQAPPTRQQQLQQQLQEQQEQILMQQRYAQRLQRARQLVVQSSESASSTMSPTLSRASLGSSDTAAGSSLSLVTPPSSGYNTTAFGRRSPEGDRLQPRRTRSSLLMSRSERHRTITEAALQGDRDTRLDDGVTMRSVLQALGQNTDSGSSIGESDQGSDLDEDEDGDEDGRGCGSGADVEVAEPRRSRAVTAGPRASGSSTDPLNRIAQRARFHTSQESTGSHGPCGQRGSFASGEAFNGRQCPSQDYWERSSASHHNPLRIHLTQIQQQQDQQHQGRRQQRASWNRRLFGGLWGHPPLEHSQQQQQQQQQREQHPLQLQARGEGHGHQEHQQQQEQPLTAST